MKNLCKSATDKTIAGVCGGIAEYLNCDSTIVRLVFAALVLGAGTGVLAYIIAAVIMPEAETSEDESSEE